MTDLRVLQEGRLRRARREQRARRLRRRRRLRYGLLTAAVAAFVLLALMAHAALGPAPIAPSRGHGAGHSSAAVAQVPPVRSGYGSQRAPPADRIQIGLKLPLRSGLLFDVRTGEVLWARDPNSVVPIASLTKMMTALIVVEHVRPRARVLITPAAVHFTGSGVGVLPLGKRVSVESLLYGLLLPSGNDAAIALAQHVGGTRSRFIAMMNSQARDMNLQCTHFNSVSGVVDFDNHSCAVDLAILARAVLEQPLLARIVGSRSVALPFPIKGGKLFLYNNNPLLVLGYPGTDGVKTGYTSAAGRCLVATARRGRAWLGVVLLNSADPPDQAQELLNAGFAKVGRV